MTKVVAGASGINAGTLGTGTNYLAAPITVNGTTVEFTTSIAEFNSKVAASAQIPATFTEAFREGAFMFLLTMEDDTQIIPMQLRIRIPK
ncbi:MAG: hypothetical protein WD824_14755 [Cyclobacteriaceae bacterium]